MSASNWAECPQCAAAVKAEFQARDASIAAAYGAVPVEEFDEMRHTLERDRVKAAEVRATFRENYEISGAGSGVVEVGYSGSCDKCGLTLNFTHEHVLFQPEPGK